MILFMYIAMGQGQTTPWGQTFDVNRSPYHFAQLLQVKNKIALKSDFIYFFFVFHHMYSPGQGQTIKVGKVLTTRENPGFPGLGNTPRNGSTGQYWVIRYFPPVFIMKYFKTACLVVLSLKLNIF